MLIIHQCINIPTDPWSLEPFADAKALRDFYGAYGCDGLEVILCGDDFADKIKPDMVYGLHTVFYPEWICLWRDDFGYMDSEFGGRDAWQSFYDAKNGAELLDIYRRELAVAKRLGAEYVVFHIGDNSLQEFMTLVPRMSDAEIVDESCDFLNELFRDVEDGPMLLLENMWIGGMNLTDPDMPLRALEKIRYPRTGFMLDTGHLMVTGRHLRTQDEGCAYIHHILDINREIAPHIHGVHLHHSLSGEYLEALPGKNIRLTGTYLERYSQSMVHLRNIDWHRPFVSSALPELIARIAPDYLVHELTHSDMEEWKLALEAQTNCLRGGNYAVIGRSEKMERGDSRV